MTQISLDQVKTMLINTFELEQTPADISPEMALMEAGLGLTSVDVLEIIVQVEKTFKIKIPNDKIRKDAFQTVGSLTSFISEFA